MSGTTGSGRVALVLFCKTPAPGRSKTRLSPPLTPQQCAELSACFIGDAAASLAAAAAAHGASLHGSFSPDDSGDALRPLLPEGFRIMPQGGGDLGARMQRCIDALLADGHRGVVLTGADAPTLPLAHIRHAIGHVDSGEDRLVLNPSMDGGYMLIGMTRPHPELFAGMPWSTGDVARLTLERAAQAGTPVEVLPRWYDVDDAAALDLLGSELSGRRPAFAEKGSAGADAPRTRKFLSRLAAGPT